MKIAEVHWYDALYAPEYWWEDNEIEDFAKAGPQIMKTVGYVAKESKEYIILYQTEAKPRSGGYFLIPKGCIIKITKLK